MRVVVASCAVMLLSGAPVLAEPPSNEPMTIQQNANTNYAVIATGKKDVSNLRIEQTGRNNAISSLQVSPDYNIVSTTQRGNWNTVVIYQEGFIDQASVVQAGPKRNGGSTNLPTSYRQQSTDEGYLTYFTSGGFSMATLTEGGTHQSRFGRSR